MGQRSAPIGCTLRAAALAALMAGLGAAGLYLLYQVPAIHDRLFWRVETARADLIRLVRPQPETLPTPLPASTSVTVVEVPATPTPAPTITAFPTGTPQANVAAAPPPPAATPLPASAHIGEVPLERQGWNNCGPATLSMCLRFWGWEGDQNVAAAWLKPDQSDKNVRPEEIVAFVEGRAGLRAAYRAGGTFDLLRRLLANGYPVMAAKGIWHGDSGWVGHYLLLTGYDDGAQEFAAHDSLPGAATTVSYDQFDTEWQMFNRNFIVVYAEPDASRVAELLGRHAEPAGAYQAALDAARAETEADPGNAFAWHNLGTSLDYFEDYEAAALAFDEARRIGLPWRMLWYQQALYSAYYHAGRYQEVMILANITLDSALGVDLEESLYWRSRAKHALGDAVGARRDLERALAFNPNFEPASRALAELEEAGT